MQSGSQVTSARRFVEEMKQLDGNGCPVRSQPVNWVLLIKSSWGFPADSLDQFFDVREQSFVFVSCAMDWINKTGNVFVIEHRADRNTMSTSWLLSICGTWKFQIGFALETATVQPNSHQIILWNWHSTPVSWQLEKCIGYERLQRKIRVWQVFRTLGLIYDIFIWFDLILFDLAIPFSSNSFCLFVCLGFCFASEDF